MALLERYKYVLLVIFLGAVLLLWPEAEEKKTDLQVGATVDTTSCTSFDLTEMEEKMARTLSQIEGTGEVQVLLTVKNSARNILAEDRTVQMQEGRGEQEVETVVISTGSGSQAPVLVEQVFPEFQGALIVSGGGDQIQVRLKLVEAVSALTGLGTDKICVCKGK